MNTKVKLPSERREVDINLLKPHPRNARTHSKKQVRQIAKSIRRWGFTNAILIAHDNTIVAGHGRVEAAKLVGMTHVSCVCVDFLSAEEQRAYLIADNKLALNADWAEEILASELKELAAIQSNFDITDLGFSVAEIDSLVESLAPTEAGDPAEEQLPDPDKTPRRCRLGDVWRLGPHRLICGNALERTVVALLMDGEQAQMVFSDPPYNVAIENNVGGLGKIKHKNFVMGCGEMTSEQFTEFLSTVFEHFITFSSDGSIHMICMDWRHLREITYAGEARYTELKNVIVWAKDNGGMGTFYRSRHEFIFAFKHGTAPHINSFELGQHGRHRTNVWEYRGVNTQRAGRAEELAIHPTCKPIPLIADAIKDVSKRGGIVLDLFGGSGSTLIAAHKTGRRARLCEIDPIYCDRILQRWEDFAKDDAELITRAS